MKFISNQPKIPLDPAFLIRFLTTALCSRGEVFVKDDGCIFKVGPSVSSL